MASDIGIEAELSREELLDAQAHIWKHILCYMNSMSLYCAVQLGIPDVIHKHGKPITLSELVNAIPINKAKSPGLFRIMRILVHSKFFEKVKATATSPEAYRLTPASRLLLRDEPLSLVPLTLTMIDPVMVDPCFHLSEWLKDDSHTSFESKYKVPFWELEGNNLRLIEMFTKAMACDAGFSVTILKNDCRHVFDGLKSMVDVGGGNGATAKAIADAFPSLKCTVLDLPHIVREGCYDNLSYVGGDMFEFVPHADAVFLKWILHDWNDEECVKILEKCREAIYSSKDNGGRVILLELVMEDEKEEDDEATQTKLLIDMQLMMSVSGKERTEKEWAKIFFDAGFKKYKINRALGLRSVIEVFP